MFIIILFLLFLVFLAMSILLFRYYLKIYKTNEIVISILRDSKNLYTAFKYIVPVIIFYLATQSLIMLIYIFDSFK